MLTHKNLRQRVEKSPGTYPVLQNCVFFSICAFNLKLDGVGVGCVFLYPYFSLGSTCFSFVHREKKVCVGVFISGRVCVLF